MPIREQIILEGKNQTGKMFGQAQRDLRNLDNQMSGILKTAGAVVAALGFGRVVSSTVNTIRTFEDLRATLTTIEGSANAAAFAFQNIRKFTAGTTFQLDEVSNAFITFRNAGLTPTIDMMTDIGNIAAGMGKRFDTVAQAVFNATTGEFEMLKQLGIKVKKEGDNITAIFRGTETTMKFTTENIIEYLRSIGREEFAGALEARAKTLTGAISNLSDAAQEFQTAIGEAGLKSELTALTREMIDLVNGSTDLSFQIGQTAAKAVHMFRDALKLAVANVDEIRGALGALAALGAASMIQRITTAIYGLSRAIVLNPIGALVTAVIALIGYLSFKNGLGRTLVQVQAAFEYLGRIVGKFRDYIAGKLSTAVDFIKNKFYDFVDSLISAYNFLADLIPGMERVDLTARETGSAIAESMGDAFSWVKEQGTGFADFLAKKLEEVEGSGKSLAETINEAGKAYDQLQKKMKAQRMLSQVRGGGADMGNVETENKSVTGTTSEQIAKEQKKLEDALNKRIQTLIGSLKTEDQRLKDKYKQDLKDLDAYYKGRAHFDQEYIRLKTKLDAQFEASQKRIYQNQIQEQLDIIKTGNMKEMDLTKLSKDQIKDLTKQTGMEALGELAKVNEKAFKINKAMNIANAIMNTAAGVTKALALGPFGIPLAFAIGALGAAQIAVIASQQYQGRRFGGPVDRNTPYVVGEAGPELFVPNANGKVIPNDQLGMSGPVNVNFNITANDTAGFDQLLADRRGLIINIINEAVTNRGKEALV